MRSWTESPRKMPTDHLDLKTALIVLRAMILLEPCASGKHAKWVVHYMQKILTKTYAFDIKEVVCTDVGIQYRFYSHLATRLKQLQLTKQWTTIASCLW